MYADITSCSDWRCRICTCRVFDVYLSLYNLYSTHHTCVVMFADIRSCSHWHCRICTCRVFDVYLSLYNLYSTHHTCVMYADMSCSDWHCRICTCRVFDVYLSLYNLYSTHHTCVMYADIRLIRDWHCIRYWWQRGKSMHVPHDGTFSVWCTDKDAT